VGPNVNLWLHLLGFAVYTGATVALLACCLPALATEPDPARRARWLAAVMRVYDPLSIAALGVIIMTGAFNLTAYKSALRGNFFAAIGWPLAWKLLLTFLLVNVAAYIAFGLGHRLVRTLDFGEDVSAERLAALQSRLRGSAIVALVLVAGIVWIAIGMTPALLPAVAGV
jgi:uncharacterized membrane protein